MPLNGSEIAYVVPVQGNGSPGATQLQTTTGAIADTRTVAAALTATGTNQATGLALTKIINYFTTVAASTGAVLPAALKPGQEITIYNAGASPLTVYGNGTDTIDTEAGSTGVTLTNAKRCLYTCISVGVWVSAQLGVVSA